jgi:cytochrome c5
VRTLDKHISRFSILTAGLVCIFSFGFVAAPPASTQDAGQAAPPAAPAAAAAPVVLPDGDGKPIATEFCQTCHKLTNLTKAHKDLDDWKDTIATMIERGAAIPPDKVDTLAQYLAKNFGPKDAAAAGSAPAAAPASPAPSPDASAPGAPAAAAKPAAAVVVELPDGDGKAIATENCQACHKLTNLTKAHKDLDDWKDTVQTMIDRGANVPSDKVDILVQYLAKNFGPKDASPAAPASAQ